MTTPRQQPPLPPQQEPPPGQFGQQPAGPYAQGPYPYGPPPRGNRGTWKYVVIPLAVIVPLFVVAVVAMWGEVEAKVLSGSGSGGGAESGEQQLSLPKKLEKSGLTLDKDVSDDPEFKNPELGWGDTQYVGWYKAGEYEAYLYTGVNDSDLDADTAADQALDAAIKDAAPAHQPKRHTFTPYGADTTITCVVLPEATTGEGFVTPICAWSEDGSVATVVDKGESSTVPSPEEYGLESFAEDVANVREDVRTPTD